MSIWFHSSILFSSFISLMVLYPCWYILLYPCWNFEVPHLFTGVFLFSLLNFCFMYFELVLVYVYAVRELLCILGKWILLLFCNATLSLIIFLLWSIFYVIFFSFLFIHVFLVGMSFLIHFLLTYLYHYIGNSCRQFILGSLFYSFYLVYLYCHIYYSSWYICQDLSMSCIASLFLLFFIFLAFLWVTQHTFLYFAIFIKWFWLYFWFYILVVLRNTVYIHNITLY